MTGKMPVPVQVPRSPVRATLMGMMLAVGDPAYEEYVKAAGIDGKKDWQKNFKREHLY